MSKLQVGDIVRRRANELYNGFGKCKDVDFEILKIDGSQAKIKTYLDSEAHLYIPEFSWVSLECFELSNTYATKEPIEGIFLALTKLPNSKLIELEMAIENEWENRAKIKGSVI